jgi:diadenosine tetraphosphate (Ap4A) HIT family hydrolase
VQNSQVIGSLLASDISFPGVLSSLFDPIAEVLVRLMAAVIKVCHAIQVALNPKGMNLITSAGETAEQTVFHLHLHVVPRWRRDGFDRIWPPEGRFEDADLEDVATRVREACADEKS